MKRRRLFHSALLLLLCLSPGAVVSAADVTAGSAEANAVVTSFAMEAYKASLSASEYADWPVPLRDSLIYTMGSRPSSEWSPQLRQFVLSRFQSHANDLNSYSHSAGQVKPWLQEQDPLKGTTLEFYLQPALGIQSVSGTFDFTTTSELYGRDAEKVQPLSLFLSSLSVIQKAMIFTSHGSIPLSALTAPQISMVKQMLHGDGDFGTINGSPIHPFDHKDALITISIIFQAMVQNTQPGADKAAFYETVLARPLNPASLAGRL